MSSLPLLPDSGAVGIARLASHSESVRQMKSTSRCGAVAAEPVYRVAHAVFLDD